MPHFVDNMQPRRGLDKPRRVLVDEKATSTLYAPPQGEPQASLKFQVPHMPQPGFFPPMTLEAFHAYTNFLYA